MQATFVDPQGNKILLRVPPGRHSIPMKMIEMHTVGEGDTWDVAATFEVAQEFIDQTKAQMEGRL